MDMLETQNFAVIKVVGVGGGGSNAVTRMIEAGLAGVEFIAMNTDLQVLEMCSAPLRLQLGESITKGLGAGGDPEIGRNAAEESRQDIKKLLEGADMVFITAGMGGGTGTGGASVVADVARDCGALTVAVVTKPFPFEGPKRARLAEEGLAALRSRVDASIVIPNERLMAVADKRLTMVEALKMADDVLRQGVQGVSDIITVPGLQNVDFADVRAIMTGAGSAVMGIGEASGESRAAEAARLAISSPLLETSIDGARGVLFNITASSDFTLDELNQAAQVINEATDTEDSFIIMGHVVDESMSDTVRITVLATGFSGQPRPNSLFDQDKQQQPTITSASRPSAVLPPKDPSQQQQRPRSGGVLGNDELDIPSFIRNRGGSNS